MNIRGTYGSLIATCSRQFGRPLDVDDAVGGLAPVLVPDNKTITVINGLNYRQSGLLYCKQDLLSFKLLLCIKRKAAIFWAFHACLDSIINLCDNYSRF